MRRIAFTLVELLVVIAIIGLLVSLLLPAVQAAREAARRTQCANNLKQVSLAILNYESNYASLPPGTLWKVSPPPPPARGRSSYGFSWWIHIMPFLEQTAVYDQFDQTNRYAGWVFRHPDNFALLKEHRFGVMTCPSSPMPAFIPSGQAVGMQSPHYAGVSGATDHSTGVDMDLPSVVGGRLSRGGVLLKGEALRMASVRDGTSNTMIVVEQSDWCVDGAGVPQFCTSDCRTGFPMGAPNDPMWERIFNLTVVLHGVNEKSYDAAGVAGNCGPNRPFQSAHPGGAMMAMVDGSVHFLSESIDLQMLYNLANRNDGNVIQLP